jgi:AraC-like DNA-binding protein
VSNPQRGDSSTVLWEWASAYSGIRWSLSRGFGIFLTSSPGISRDSQSHRALDLIRESRKPLAVIANEVGFSDQAHMSRSIKK